MVVDADLAILATPADRYDRYTRDVRAEYPQLDDDAWRTGRTAVLNHLLSAPLLFHVGADRTRRDSQARANMQRELTELSRW